MNRYEYENSLRDLLEPMLQSQAPDAAGAEPLQRLGDLAAL